MEHGYKHFSHSHNLVMHQLPEGVDVSCSGCNSSGNGAVFVCWQCNFFLHDQCYRATRSLKHPSHPPHPLTLVPYPTYPSNSFYCNSCEIIGTGFSYSCAHCEFDLHVQCAHSISRATGIQKTHQYPTNYYNPDHQELVPPNWNGQNSGMPQNVPFASVPDNLHHHLTATQNPYMDPTNPVTTGQYHSTCQNLGYVSIPPVGQNSDTNADGHSLSIPGNPPYSIAGAQYPSMAQTGHSVSIPLTPQDSVTGTPYPSTTQPRPYVSIPTSPPNLVTSTGDPSKPQNGPSVSTLTGSLNPTLGNTSVSIPTNNQNPITNDQKFNMAQNIASASIPTTSLNPVTSPQYPTLGVASVSIPSNNQNPITNDQKLNMADQNNASVSIPAASPPDYQPESHAESVQNKLNQKGIMHFSHPHSLCMVNLQDKDNEIDCSGCEETLNGKGYSCVESNCDFHLHESCFNLKKEIQHKSHPEHPLTLLPLSPYNNENGEFTCNACFSDGTGFTYHCSICKFDLHIQCVSLPETVKRSDHEHILKLYYSCPVKDEEYTFTCDVCHVAVQEDRWTYYCESCDYGTHLGCVDCEECVVDSVLDVQMQLQRLQFQMELSRQNAQMVASMGASLLSLV